MKTVTLKTDENFFEKLTVLAKELHLTKSELIRRAVSEYEKHIQRQRLKNRFKEASLKVRESNTKLTEEFETTLLDGLEDD
ncbi:MAG: ribbon-helix-helix protein, CopG family [Epsilonproteobacteria bacterium]|nr:ribbon-helix-helix protein, CopG family [Campylobacterota bacterium]